MVGIHMNMNKQMRKRVKPLVLAATLCAAFNLQAADKQIAPWLMKPQERLSESLLPKLSLSLLSDQWNGLSSWKKIGIGIAGSAVSVAALYGLDRWRDFRDPNVTLQRAVQKNNWLSEWRINRIADKLTGDNLQTSLNELTQNNNNLRTLLQGLCNAKHQAEIQATLGSSSSSSSSASSSSSSSSSTSGSSSSSSLSSGSSRSGFSPDKFCSELSHSVDALKDSSQDNAQLSALLAQLNQLDLDDVNVILNHASADEKVCNALAQCAVRNGRVDQVMKCLYQRKVLPHMQVNEGKASLFEWYVQHEDNLDQLSSVCEKIDNLAQLCNAFGEQCKFSLLIKLQDIGSCKDIDFSACGFLAIDSLRDYVSLKVKRSGLKNDTIEEKLIAKIVHAIQSQGSRVPRLYVDEMIMNALTQYEFKSQISEIYNAHVVNLTGQMKKQQGDECGYYAAFYGSEIFKLLKKNPAAIDFSDLESLKIGPDIQALKKYVRENPDIYEGHCNPGSVDNLDYDAVNEIMKAQYGIQADNFTVIESMSLFLPERDESVMNAFSKLNEGNAVHIFIFKDLPHWTFMVAHRKVEGEPLVLYVGDSKNQNGNSEVFNPFETFSDVSDLDLSGFNMAKFLAERSSASSVKQDPGHSDINSIVRLAYFLSRPQEEREFGAAIYSKFDEVQTNYDLEDIQAVLSGILEIVDIAEKRGRLNSMHFVQEYVLKTHSSGVGLLEMLRKSMEFAEAFGFNCADLNACYEKLVQGCDLMSEYPDNYVQVSETASSVPEDGTGLPPVSSGPISS